MGSGSPAGSSRDVLGDREESNDEHVVRTDAAATVMIALEGDGRGRYRREERNREHTRTGKKPALKIDNGERR